MKIELSILIVHYHSEDYLEPLIGSMREFLNNHEAEALIWDNGSKNGQPEGLFSTETVKWFRSPQNFGFARGHLALAEKAQGEWFLILNPDTKFQTEGLERLWKTAQGNPKAGIVVPGTVYPDGRTQPAVFPPYTFWFDLKKSFWLEHSTFLSQRLNRLWGDPAHSEKPFQVGWASGACLLVRREVWEKTGGFDPQFFFGGEDADFCRRVWEAGFEVLCEPRAVLLHQGGQSLMKEHENKIFYYYQKRLYFARKHFSRWQYAILYLVSFFELVLKWLAGLVLGIFKQEWMAKRRGYARTLFVLSSPPFSRPGEWMARWTQTKTTQAGLAL